MALFFNRFTPIIGLQLSGSTVKCIELRQQTSKELIRACAYASLPRNIIVNDITYYNRGRMGATNSTPVVVRNAIT